mgnify:CR=1 FL=1
MRMVTVYWPSGGSSPFQAIQWTEIQPIVTSTSETSGTALMTLSNCMLSIFWVSVTFVFYAYMGYPLLLMAIGMVLTGLAFFVMYFAGRAGGDVGKVSPWWLVGAYGVLTLGELMLSPMGLSLVSKVAPQRFRGVMMGGWFVATAIGNKLTMIAIFWDRWLHSTFFAVLGACALAMSVVLMLLLKPLKKAMPGI